MATEADANSRSEYFFRLLDQDWLQDTIDDLAKLCRATIVFTSVEGMVLAISPSLRASSNFEEEQPVDQKRQISSIPLMGVMDASKERVARRVSRKVLPDIEVSHTVCVNGTPIGCLSLRARPTSEISWKIVHDELRMRGINVYSKDNKIWRKDFLKDVAKDRAMRIERVLKLLSYTIEHVIQNNLREHGFAEIAKTVVSTSAGESTELDVLTAVLERLPSCIQFDVGRIMLIDWRKGLASVLASKVETNVAKTGPDEFQNEELSVERGIVGWVARHKQSLRVSDVKNNEHYYCRWDRAGSELAVPIVLGDRVLGVFDLEAEELDHFTERDEQDLRTIAATVASALSERVWHNRFAALEKLNGSLAESPNLTVMADKVAADIFRLFPHLDICNIWIYDEDWATLKLIGDGTRNRQPVDIDQLSYYIPVDRSVSGKLVLEEKSGTAYDLLQNPQIFWRQFIEMTGAKAMLCVPMPRINAEKPFGCINLYSTQDYLFNRDDIQLLETISKFVAKAIDNLKNSLILSTHREIGEACGRDEIGAHELNKVAEIIRAKTGARAASIFLPDAALDQKLGTSERLYLKGTTGFPGISNDDFHKINYEPGEGMTGWVWKHRKSIRLPGKFKREDLSLYGNGFCPKHKHIESVTAPAPMEKERDFLMVPIELRSGKAGVIRASCKDQDLPFTPYDKEILEAVAKQLASGLAVADKFRSLTERITKLFTVAELVTEPILDERGFLSLMAQQALEAVGGDAVSIFLYNPIISDFDTHIGFPDNISDINLEIDSFTNKMIQKAFKDQEAQIIRSTSISKATKENESSPSSEGLSLLALPLSGSNKRLGVVTVTTTKIDGYNESDIQTLQCFAYIAAALITAGRFLQDKDDFIATLVHQLVGPIAAIDANCYDLNEFPIMKGIERNEVLTEITTLAKLASNISHNYRYVEKVLKTGSVKLTRHRMLVETWLDDTITLYQPLATCKNQNILFEKGVFISNIFADVDEKLMPYVFMNILDNAIKYSPDDSSIKVSLSQDAGESCTVCVENLGCPIAESETDRVFSRGYRTPLAKEFGFGNGIGLTVARTIAKLHGGNVWIETGQYEYSSGLAVTRCYMQLPMADALKSIPQM